MRKLHVGIILILVFTVLSSCVRVRAISYDEVDRKPKPTNFPVEIIDSESIEKEYKVIGEVSGEAINAKSSQAILEKLRTKVREMGGDAMIELERGNSGAGYYNASAGSAVYNSNAKQNWTAKVIVWVEGETE